MIWMNLCHMISIIEVDLVSHYTANFDFTVINDEEEVISEQVI